MFMEILAPYFPPFFTLIVCTAGVFKVGPRLQLTQSAPCWLGTFKTQATNQNWSFVQSIVGVAGGATRAALTVHQARRDNMADVSAKDGSQVPPSFKSGPCFLLPEVINNRWPVCPRVVLNRRLW